MTMLENLISNLTQRCSDAAVIDRMTVGITALTKEVVLGFSTKQAGTINRYAIPIFAQMTYREHRFDADINLYVKELAEFLDVALGVSPTGAVTIQRNLFHVYDEGGKQIIVADEAIIFHRLAKEFMAGFDQMHPRKPE